MFTRLQVTFQTPTAGTKTNPKTETRRETNIETKGPKSPGGRVGRRWWGAGGDGSRRRPPSVSGPGLLHAVVGLRRRHVRRLGEEVLVELCHEPGG